MTNERRIHRVGDIEIERVTETVFDGLAPKFLIPDWDDKRLVEEFGWLVPDALSEDHANLIVSIHSWIVRTPHHLIVIDTGIGNGRKRSIPLFTDLDTAYYSNLLAAVGDPAQVDYVLCTHLHVDHVGWNTHRVGNEWVPTFSNARYIWSSVEQGVSATAHFEAGVSAGVYADSILPIIQAGRVDQVHDNGGEVLEGVFFHPTPGHTAGHMSISVRSKGEEAFFSGDVVHNPVQMRVPEWNSAFCEMHAPARASRRWALDYAAERRALFLPAHFRGSSAGHVSRRGEQFSWTFA